MADVAAMRVVVTASANRIAVQSDRSSELRWWYGPKCCKRFALKHFLVHNIFILIKCPFLKFQSVIYNIHFRQLSTVAALPPVEVDSRGAAVASAVQCCEVGRFSDWVDSTTFSNAPWELQWRSDVISIFVEGGVSVFVLKFQTYFSGRINVIWWIWEGTCIAVSFGLPAVYSGARYGKR